MNIPVRQSSRAKNISIVVHWDGRCEMVVPKRRPPSEEQIKRFINKNIDWINRQVSKSQKFKKKIHLTHQGISIEKIKEQTLELIEECISTHSERFQFEVKSIKLRNYKAQWGSCSTSGSLGFHYKLSLLPKELADYIIVHELCHSVHFNHSKTFWKAVEFFCPQHKSHRKALKQYLL